MRTRLRRCSCRVTLGAALAVAATSAGAQPIEAGSQDVFARSAGDDFGRDQGLARQDGRRSLHATGRNLGAGSPDFPAASPWSRGRVDAAPYGAYEGYGANGAGQGTMAWSGDDSGAYDEDRRAPAAAYGGPGRRTQPPLEAGSLYGGSTINGTAAGPQYSNQLPAPRDRFRR